MQNFGVFAESAEKDFPKIEEQAYEASVKAFLAERYKGKECIYQYWGG